MTVISVSNQKGGSGKTTIAINLADGLQRQGYKVLVVDSDPQGSARDWNAENDGEVLPVIGLDRESLPKDVLKFKSQYDFIVIDSGSKIERMASAAIKAADIVLIPVQPSPYDVWAVSELVDLVKARQEVTDGIPKAAFIVSRAIKNTLLSNEVIEALSSYELPVLESRTNQSVVYPTTASQGLTVFSDSSSKASTEIENLCKEVIAFSAIKSTETAVIEGVV